MTKMIAQDQLGLLSQGMEPEHVPPVILSLQPGPGDTASGSLIVRAGDGNMWQQQIDIEEIQLLVDGQDVTCQLLYDTDLTLDPTRPHFEILTIRYPLPPGLAPGAHSATLTVGDRGTVVSPSNKTVNTWSFVLPPSQPRRRAGLQVSPPPGDFSGSPFTSRRADARKVRSDRKAYPAPAPPAGSPTRQSAPPRPGWLPRGSSRPRGAGPAGSSPRDRPASTRESGSGRTC